MFPNMHWTAKNFHPCSLEHVTYYRIPLIFAEYINKMFAQIIVTSGPFIFLVSSAFWDNIPDSINVI